VVQWCLIVLLAAVFSGLAVYRILSRDRAEVNEEKLRALGTATLAPAPRPAGAEWPQWRGPNRDGTSPETDVLLDWPADGLKTLWTRPSGEGFSTVVVARGRAFTVLQDGADEAVVCWDAATGKEHWRFRYPAAFRNEYGNGPRSTPAVAGDHVYTVGATGVMHCLKAFTDNPQGEKVWRRDLLQEFGAHNLLWGVSFSPLVEGGLVYVMPGGPGGNSVAGLDRDTGATVWKALDDLPSYSSPVVADLGGRRQIIFFTAERLLGVEPATGRLLWDFPWRTAVPELPMNIATPLVIGDRYVFISSGYDKGCALVEVAKDGDALKATQVYKNRKLRSHFASVVRVGEYLYGFDDTTLACLELKTGKQKWRERGFDKGSLIAAAGHLIVLGEQGALALVVATPEEYREKARFEHSQLPSSWSTPSLAEGRLYVRDKTRVVCYDIKARK
jgi:outer membrane protein assembly factor BamB